MKKLIFLTLFLSVAILFVSCQGDTDTQIEETTGNEEIVAETVSNAELTSDEEIVLETVTTTSELISIPKSEGTTVTLETENGEPYEIKADDYTLIKNGKGCYIKFDDISIYESDASNNASGLSEVPNLKFNSIKEFKDVLTNGTLENSQKEVICKFAKNNFGEIQTCDFNNLYNVLLPDGLKVSYIKWYGAYYIFFVESENGSWINSTVAYINDVEYNNFLQKEYGDFLNSAAITETICEKIGDKEFVYEKTRISETVANYGSDVYILQMGSKKIIVNKTSFENDVLGLYPEGEASYLYTLDCFEGDSYYKIEFDFLSEEPLDVWLLQFGLATYIDNDHEVM